MNSLSERDNFLNDPEEELDYEYSDSESSEVADFCGSPSPERDIYIRLKSPDYLYDEHETKKLRRIFTTYTELRVQHHSKRRWGHLDFVKSSLNRWRIRSLDPIFGTFENNDCLILSPKKVTKKQSEGMESLKLQEMDQLSDLSVIVNNDLCTPTIKQEICDFSASNNTEANGIDHKTWKPYHQHFSWPLPSESHQARSGSDPTFRVTLSQ